MNNIVDNRKVSCIFCSNLVNTKKICKNCYDNILELIKKIFKDIDIEKIAIEEFSKHFKGYGAFFKYENAFKKKIKDTSGGKFIIEDFYYVFCDRYITGYINTSIESIDLSNIFI